MKKAIIVLAALAASLTAAAQVKVAVHETAQDQPVIPAEIYGQFSEHLGKCIYEGICGGDEVALLGVFLQFHNLVTGLGEDFHDAVHRLGGEGLLGG